jgi:hypothetical protein
VAHLNDVTYLDRLLVVLLQRLEVLQRQPLCPVALVQVHQHALLQLRLPIIDGDRIIMSVQAVDESLNGRLIDMADIRGRLPRLAASYHSLGLDQAECVYDHFAFDRLNRINDNCHRTRVK